MKTTWRGGDRAALRIVVLAMAGIGLSGLVLSQPSPAAADSLAVNLAVADATGVQGRYTIPDLFIVNEYFNGSGPTTQSIVDRSGRSVAYAALPYPGENVVSAPGLLAVGSGQSVPVSYPFYVQANHPSSPKAETKDPSGTYSLQAEADATKATSHSALRFADSVSESAAQADTHFDGEQAATATASTVERGISLGDGTLRIASIQSRSVASLEAGQDRPSTSSELLVEGATVAGHPVTIDRDGVHFDQTGAPNPLASGAASAEEILKQAGISITFVTGGPIGDGSGSASDALLVTVKHPVPAATNTEGLFELRFGGASTFLSLGAAPDLVNLPDQNPVPVPQDTTPVTSPTTPPDPSALDITTPGLSTPFSTGLTGAGAIPSTTVNSAFQPGLAALPVPSTPPESAAPSPPARRRVVPAATTQPALRPLHTVEFAYILILVAGLLFGATHWIIGSREMRTS